MELPSPDRTDSGTKDILVSFLKSFAEMKYRARISAMPSTGQSSLVIDFGDVASFDMSIAIDLQQHPKRMLKLFDAALVEVLSNDTEIKSVENIHARIRGLYDTLPLRALRNSHESQLVAISGIVNKTHQVRSIATVLRYRCTPDQHLNEIEADDFSWVGKFPRPWKCNSCDSSRFYLDKEATKKEDFQVIGVQEMPEELPPGEIPRTCLAYAFGDMVDRVRPGERVLLTTIVQTEIDGRSRAFDTRLLVNYLEVVGRNPEDARIEAEEEEEFRALARSPGAYNKLIQSVNPAIYGNEIVKEAILLQMVGSSQKQLRNGVTLRGDISILLVGDPGISKSQMLVAAVKSAPRGFYTIGRGTTAAGLGAAVVKEHNESYSLEAGAAVWCDLGLLAIDEFATLREDDVGVLNEVMEQQRVSIAKAGINVNLNARVSVLAAMNPVDYKYNIFKNIFENIGSKIPTPLLTRFDLIFAMVDVPDHEKDTAVTSYLAQMRNSSTYPTEPPLTQEYLKRYLTFAKRTDPKLTEEAVKRLQEYYLEKRRSADPDAITVTPRWFEASIRLTLARARVLLHEVASEEDALRATSIMEAMMIVSLKDTSTKKPDPGILYGRPVSERGLREEALTLFKKLSGETKQPVEDKSFYDEMEKMGKFTREQVEKAFQNMWKSGVIYEVTPHFYKKV